MLIQNDAELRKYLPNALTTVEGETPLYDKISPYLSKAQAWLAKHFTGTDILTAIETAEPADPLRELCAHIVAVDAFRRAIPSLDLILTPNGFGIVSNQNVVPASADRVKRLIDSLLTNRDSLANTLLDNLAKRADWLSSGQAFGLTSNCHTLPGTMPIHGRIISRSACKSSLSSRNWQSTSFRRN